MKTIEGTNNRIIEIDLTARSFREIRISPADRRKYIGGKGLALKLLAERLRPGEDPLGEGNVFILTTGVLIGTGAPNSARFSAVAKSPLTGIITHSSCGGPFGRALKTSGWDGLVVSGKADSPVFLVIDSSGVEFMSARDMWGETTSRTEKHLSKFGKGSLAIGPAGENRVRFANISSGGRFLGRGGLGAVLGSKNIKGITARGGECAILPRKPELFRKLASRGFRYIKRNPFTGERYRNFGTLMHMGNNNRAGILPVNNFAVGSSEKAGILTGEFIQKTRNTRFDSCRNCTILCGHSGEFNARRTSVPEYETVSILGTNLGVFDMDRISEWNDICGELGLDTISAGGTLAFVMEAAEKGLIDSPLGFGSPEHVSETLKNTAFRKGFGNEMAEGSRRLSGKYGGKAFCMTVKGMEMSGYHPSGSSGMGLNYAVANRGGCHLSSTVFGLEVDTKFLNPLKTFRKAVYVEFMENIVAAINSLHTCHFTIYPYVLESVRLRYFPKAVIRLFMLLLPGIAKKFIDLGIYAGLFSAVTGIRISPRELLRAGKRAHVLERYLNTREGISAVDDTLPRKLIAAGLHGSSGKPYPLEKMVRRYYRIRGYDHNGIPLPSLLRSLGIGPGALSAGAGSEHDTAQAPSPGGMGNPG